MSDQNQVLNATPKFNTHKVFATIGIILTIVILIGAGLWWYTDSQTPAEEDEVTISTSSAKPATNSATKSATISAQ